ncbi:MAG: HAD hydrolase family protein, partial [Pseudomonadota bacterium]
RAELNNHQPFVIENGAAIYLPANYFKQVPSDVLESDGYLVKEFVEGRDHWQSILQRQKSPPNDAFITFQEAGIKKIAEMTGLNHDQASLASERRYGEPLKWLGSEQEFDIFKKSIEQEGGKLLKGGRFVHLSGYCDKGLALRWLMDMYQSSNIERNCVSIGLGDSENDMAMLEAADYGILIKSPSHQFPAASDNIYKTQALGPKGWVEGVTNIIKKLGIKLDNKG